MTDMTASFILRADASQARRELAAAGGAVKNMGAASDQAARGIKGQAQASDHAARALQAQHRAAQSGIGSMTVLARAATAAGAALGTVLTSRALAAVADGWSDMSSRIGAAVRDMEAAPALMRDMLRLANASYSSLGQTVDLFAGNVTAMRDLGYETQATLDYTESLNHMLVITATKGEAATSVQNALSKAMAVGRLDALGLETVLSKGSRVAEALARELGVNVSQLRGLASQGRITGEVIARAVITALQDVRREAGDMPTTVEDGLLKIGNSARALVGVLDQTFGTSGAIAERLDRVAMGVGALAAADFSGLMDGMAAAGQTLGQVLMVLAATRIPAVIGAVAGLNIGTAIMNGQLIAGAIASRGMTVALAAQAAAARGLGAALAFAGGPMGLLAAGAAGLALLVYNLRRETVDLSVSLGEVSTQQTEVNDAFETFYRERTPEALKAMVALAEANAALAQSTLAAARRELEDVELSMQALTDLNDSMGRSTAVPFELGEAERNLKSAEAAAQATADALARAINAATSFGAETVKTAESVEQQTAAQEKAEAAARRQLMQLQDQARINALIARHGEESLSVTVARYGAERRLFAAQVESLDITRALKDQLIEAWQAERGMAQVNVSGPILAAVGAADALWGKLQGVLGTVRGILGELGRIGFETIGVQAETAALRAGKSAAEARMEGELAQERARLESGGLSGVEVNIAMAAKRRAAQDNLAAVTARDAELAKRRPSGGAGRQGAGHGGSTTAALADERDAMADLIEEQKRLIATLHEADPVQREIMANHEALAKATAGETAELRGLIAERQRLEKVKSLTEEIGSAGRQAFSSLVRGAGSLRDALSRVLDKMADMAASSLWDQIWQGAPGGGGGIGGIVTGLIGGLLGGLPARADGGPIRGPGGPREDKVLLWGSNGEYVVNASATAANRGLIEAINAGAGPDQLAAMTLGARIPRLAEGGMVGRALPRAIRPASPAGTGRAEPREDRRTVFEINVTGTGTAEIRQGVMTAISQAFDAFTRELLPFEVKAIVNDRWGT